MSALATLDPRQSRGVRRRYLKLPSPVMGATKASRRSRCVVEIYPEPQRLDLGDGAGPTYRGLYLSIRGFPDGTHGVYTLCNTDGLAVAELGPAPMESWDNPEPRAPFRDVLLRLCSDILAESGEIRTNTPADLVTYLGFLPYPGCSIDTSLRWTKLVTSVDVADRRGPVWRSGIIRAHGEPGHGVHVTVDLPGVQQPDLPGPGLQLDRVEDVELLARAFTALAAQMHRDNFAAHMRAGQDSRG